MKPSSAKKGDKIFFSYRRKDSAGHTGRLRDSLISHFGKRRLFVDLDSIAYGANYRTAVEAAIGSSAALIAVIGPQWATVKNAEGTRRRLDDPKDLVRLEIAAALKLGIPVIPVLVDGAQMPGPNDLPDEIAGLADINAVEISDLRWDYDTKRLISAVEGAVPAQVGLRLPGTKLLWGAGALLLAVSVVLAALKLLPGGGNANEAGGNANAEPTPPSPRTEALQKIAGDAKYATEYLNELFHMQMAAPQVELSAGSTGIDAYWEPDAGKLVAGPGVRFLPDITYLNVAHPFIRSQVDLEYQGQSGSIQMSYAEILALLIKQKRLGRPATDADWTLGEGYNAVLSGQDPATEQTKSVMVSLREPGARGTFDVDGMYQVSNYRNLYRGPKDNGGIHINSGIPNKAFYETAIRIGSDAAGRIWVDALRGLQPDSDIKALALSTYQTAKQLFGDNSDQEKSVKDAWRKVGIPVG